MNVLLQSPFIRIILNYEHLRCVIFHEGLYKTAVYSLISSAGAHNSWHEEYLWLVAPPAVACVVCGSLINDNM